ncbi:LOW QUALITY PROTEIN: hypothetical protein QC762_302585 [Podospora pseudocomata]|uniref:Uncharacterized protein n=1 Tax=Podospora pseudocomata TaxID=2093779 RepID=A0ABR0GI59_9PEZI|nr:LOW QUALITY PROTEIN: hypothetical protein QC762_302585 [Podospora pseudocomata]
MVEDHRINGETIPSGVQDPSRRQELNEALWLPMWHLHLSKVGLYGSAPGVVFSTGDNTKFSVGMNCPDTAFGGTNSIRLLVGHDAKGVAEHPDGNGYAPQTARTNGHTCTGRRAADLGSVNYAILSVQQGGVGIADDNNFGNRCPEQKTI